jgi:signal transduction histidine kinase
MRRLVISLLACLFPFFALAEVTHATTDEVFHELTSASFRVNDLQKNVTLPHQLELDQYENDLVSYTLQINLDKLPVNPLAIYVPKFSLSGRVFVNDQYLGTCAWGALEKLRCLHKPQFFTPHISFWKLGLNTLRFDIYTDSSEINGLSRVWIGEAEMLRRNLYSWRYFLQVDLLTGLTWFSIVLGLLGLGVGLVQPSKEIYFWFGITSISNALANILKINNFPFLELWWLTWLVFSSHFIFVTTSFLMYLAWFDKLSPKLRKTGLAYGLLGTVLIGFFDSNRLILTALYLPLLVAGMYLVTMTVIWSLKSRQPSHILGSILSVIILTAGVHDGIKLRGIAAFENIYLMTYAYSGVLIVLGVTLFSLFVYALIDSEKLSNSLEERVIERSRELERTYDLLIESERQRSKTQEREQLLKDLHDGFGTQLVTARMLLNSKKMNQDEMENLLHECISDLYLVLDISNNEVNHFYDLIIDFKNRISLRLPSHRAKLLWHVQENELPNVSKNTALNILRVAQEGLNNAIKYSQSANIWISLTYESTSRVLVLKVADDGVGFPSGTTNSRGLKNMSQRANTLGGSLAIYDNAPGTSIELQLVIQTWHLKASLLE